MGCTGDLPIATDMGHWDEDCLALEFMTPLLKWNSDQIFSPITMGALEDLGYTVDRSEQDTFELSDLETCGDFCPEARRRRLGMGNRTKTSSPASPKLSQEAEMELMNAAADRFRQQKQHVQKLQGGELEFSAGSVSYVYEENGHIFSRTIHHRQVEHLL